MGDKEEKRPKGERINDLVSGLSTGMGMAGVMDMAGLVGGAGSKLGTVMKCMDKSSMMAFAPASSASASASALSSSPMKIEELLEGPVAGPMPAAPVLPGAGSAREAPAPEFDPRGGPGPWLG